MWVLAFYDPANRRRLHARGFSAREEAIQAAARLRKRHYRCRHLEGPDGRKIAAPELSRLVDLFSAGNA
jgi:hypothetical protein